MSNIAVWAYYRQAQPQQTRPGSQVGATIVSELKELNTA